MLLLISLSPLAVWKLWTSSPQPLVHSAYIWQRQWQDGLRRAILAGKESLSGWVVLAGELDFPRGLPPRVARVEIDYAALRAAGRPVGFALRINPFTGPFGPEQAETLFLVDLAKKIRDQARRNGLEPSMIQIDFDAATSKIDGYRQWIEVLRKELAPTPLVITVLPAWMEASTFPELIQAADAYVLQVHSLDAKLTADNLPALCDPKQAEAAVLHATRLGRPFWVALPTYGYRAWFDKAGKILLLEGEGETIAKGNRVQSRELRADPAAMAGLVRRFTALRPPGMQGIIWYRFPDPADQFNWSLTTLQTVMAGREPRATTEVLLDGSQPGLVEVSLAATGEMDSVFEEAVTLKWENGALLAADGLAGFTPERASPASLRFSYQGGAPLHLAPGRLRPIGWLRFAQHTEVSAHVATSYP